jgi:hypothetical protein
MDGTSCTGALNGNHPLEISAVDIVAGEFNA